MEFDISLTDAAEAQLRKSIELRGIKNLGVRINGSFSACCGIRYSLSLEETSMEDDVVKKVNGITFFVIYPSGSYCGGGA